MCVPSEVIRNVRFLIIVIRICGTTFRIIIKYFYLDMHEVGSGDRHHYEIRYCNRNCFVFGHRFGSNRPGDVDHTGQYIQISPIDHLPPLYL